MKCVLLSILLAALSLVSKGQTTTRPDGAQPAGHRQVKYVCEGETLRLPWTFILEPGQTLRDVQWYFHGHSEEVIAIFAYDHFQPMPAFSHRVSLITNAGIELHHVSEGDRGEYSVRITGQNVTSGALFSSSMVAYVQVSEGLMTTDKGLHVHQDRRPVFDNTTQQWAVRLTCGHFTYIGHPPFDVVWTTPDNHTVNSTRYSDGQFQLLLTGPVTAGPYSCQIPPSALHDACLTSLVADSVTVDDVTARLSLLEANQATLLTENAELKHQLNVLGHKIQEMGSSRAVSFLATLQNDKNSTSKGTTIVFDKPVSNHGNAYNATSGLFIAPVSGDYFFAITTRCSNGNADAEVVTSSTGPSHLICRVDSDVVNDAGSCQGLVHLDEGGQVWVRAFEMDPPFACYRADVTVFTGFLVTPTQ